MTGDLVERAKDFATRAHAGQMRKDVSDNPYIVHPAEVASLVGAAGGNIMEIAAAWLHDTAEDTATTIEDIAREFGREVARIVDGLTDLPGMEKLPLAERKEMQAQRVRSESRSVKLVKLADQTSNVAGLREKRDMPVERGLTYAHGAKKIAEACRGISAYLDDLFLKQYEMTISYLREK